MPGKTSSHLHPLRAHWEYLQRLTLSYWLLNQLNSPDFAWRTKNPLGVEYIKKVTECKGKKVLMITNSNQACFINPSGC